MGFLKNFFTNVFHEQAPAMPGRRLRQALRRRAGGPPGRRPLRRLRAQRRRPAVVQPGSRAQRRLPPRCLPRRREPHECAGPDGGRHQEPHDGIVHALIESLGDVVDVVLETSHGSDRTATPICTANTSTCRSCRARCGTSKTCLINDGCTGIAVLNPSIPQEVQLDEHKLLIVYGKDLSRIRKNAPRQPRSLPRGHALHHRSRARALHLRALRRRSSKN